MAASLVEPSEYGINYAGYVQVWRFVIGAKYPAQACAGKAGQVFPAVVTDVDDRGARAVEALRAEHGGHEEGEREPVGDPARPRGRPLRSTEAHRSILADRTSRCL